MPFPDILAHPVAASLLSRVRGRMVSTRNEVIYANREQLPALPSKACKDSYRTLRHQLGKDDCYDLIAPRKVVL